MPRIRFSLIILRVNKNSSVLQCLELNSFWLTDAAVVPCLIRSERAQWTVIVDGMMATLSIKSVFIIYVCVTWLCFAD